MTCLPSVETEIVPDQPFRFFQHGAKTTVVYRRTLAEAPANLDEIAFAQSLGVGFCFQFRPVAIEGERSVSAFRAAGTDGESHITLKADQVILAIGQSCENPELGGVSRTEKNLILVENGATNLPGVFAGGDITNGGKTVVQAVADGKLAAYSMHEQQIRCSKVLTFLGTFC